MTKVEEVRFYCKYYGFLHKEGLKHYLIEHYGNKNDFKTLIRREVDKYYAKKKK